jgi:hypothetical protein
MAGMRSACDPKRTSAPDGVLPLRWVAVWLYRRPLAAHLLDLDQAAFARLAMMSAQRNRSRNMTVPVLTAVESAPANGAQPDIPWPARAPGEVLDNHLTSRGTSFARGKASS